MILDERCGLDDRWQYAKDKTRNMHVLHLRTRNTSGINHTFTAAV